MCEWSIPVKIIEETSSHFYYRSFQYKTHINIGDFSLIEIQQKEYRKEQKLYYSNIKNYRLFGYLLKNNPHAMLDYIVCTGCFEKVTNYDTCTTCNKDFNEDNSFFLNSVYFFSYTYYNELKEKYNLATIDEIYRDQRHNLCNPLKQEIYAAALHPDKIVRILELTNDLEHLDNYI